MDVLNKKKRTFFGNLWRSVVKNNIPLGDTIVNAIDGGSASEVIKAISKDNKMSPEQKEIIVEGINKDIEQERELTKRWESDNNSQDWLPRNIRPLAVANFTLLIDIVILSSMWGKPLGEAYLPLLLTMGMTVIGGYFTLREFGKNKEKK
tara:strand:- start:3 stop:452 length:450 start_codon:yes stop_codon:yes gene_type:complete